MEETRSADYVTFGGNSGLGQIQFAFNTAHNLVIDPAFIPEANHGLTLYPQCLERKPKLAIVIGGASSTPTSNLETRETLAIVPYQVLIDRGRLAVLFACLFQMGDGCFDHNAPGVPFLEVRPGGSGQTERADKRGQRDALQYQGDENDAERQKND